MFVRIHSYSDFLQIRVFGYKGSANRRQYKTKAPIFVFIVEMQPTIYKGSANGRQYKKSTFFVFTRYPVRIHVAL